MKRWRILGLSLVLLGGCVTAPRDIQPIATATTQPTATMPHQGDVVFQDGFEDGFQGWDFFIFGAGADYNLATSTQRSGEYSLQLVAGDGEHSSTSNYLWASPLGSRVGYELSLVLEPGVKEVWLWLDMSDGLYTYVAAMQYDNLTNSILFFDELGAMQNVASELELEDHKWHTVKIVVDSETTEYVQFIVDGQEYPVHESLSESKVSQPSSSAVMEGTGITLEVHAQDGQKGIVYIDDVFVTYNEP